MTRPPPSPPPSDAPGRSLSEREREIARRVRRALHLPASMSEEEVANELYDTFAWKRERIGLAREEARRALADATRPAFMWARERATRLIRSVWRRWRRFWT